MQALRDAFAQIAKESGHGSAAVRSVAIATESPECPLLTTVQLAELPFSIAVSRKDKVADGPFVTLEASRTTAGSCLSASCILRSTITCSPISRKQKIAPKKIRHTTAPEEAFPLVRAGECIAFVVKTGALLLARDGGNLRSI